MFLILGLMAIVNEPTITFMFGIHLYQNGTYHQTYIYYLLVNNFSLYLSEDMSQVIY